MKEFPTLFNAEKNKKIGASPVWILKCPFPSTGTIYLSDMALNIAGWNGGITTKSWIQSWGQIDEDISGDMSLTKVSDFSLEVIIAPDASPDINTILWTAANNVEVTDCELYLWFRGLDAGTDPPQKMWTGNIVDFQKINETAYQIQFVDISVRLDKYIGTKIDAAIYPGADPDEIGKIGNIIYGAVNNVRCHAIDAGAASPLVADITAAQTDCEVSDASRFPATPFTIQCETEQMRVTGKNGNIFTITRGYNSTTATAHAKNIISFEVRSEYVYLAADHPAKTMGDVYVDTIRQVSAVTKYTGQSGNEHAGYPGKAVLAFSVKPEIQKQINIGLDDPTHYHISETTKERHPSSAQKWGSTVAWTGIEQNVYDFSDMTSLKANYTGTFNGIATINAVFPAYTGLAPSAIYVCAVHKSYHPSEYDAWNYIKMYGNVGGSFYMDKSNQKVVQKCLMSGTTVPTDIYFEMACGVVSPYPYIEVFEIWLELVFDKTAAALTDLALTGNSSADIVIGSLITINIEGYKDDSGGTYTGTPNALIARPDHTFKHFLYTYAGVAVANFYTNAASQFSSKGYNFVIVITDYKKLKEWLAYMAFQCRCYFRLAAGQAQLLWRPDSLSSQKTITAAMISMNDSFKTSTRGPRRSPLDEIINKITIHYDKDWSKSGDEAYKALSPASNSASITKYGEKEKPELFKFDFVTLAAMANDMRDFYIAKYKDRKKLLEIELFLDNSELEFADAVTITPQGSLLCEVQKSNIFPGSGKENRNDKIILIVREY